MAEQQETRWEGKAVAELKGPKPEQVWPFLEDFFNLHKWFPGLATCRRVDDDGGLIRYCESTPVGEDEAKITWARERLIDIDPIGRWLSYEVLDNNMGFGNYVATARVTSFCDGSRIEWSFVCDPVEGWRSEDLVAYLDSCVKFMAAKILPTLD